MYRPERFLLGFDAMQVKVKVQIKFILEEAKKTQTGSRGITLLFL
jgi:hypothetical protein